MTTSMQLIIDAEAIAKRIRELGAKISEKYGDEPLVMVCVLKGAFIFFADLVRAMTIEPEVDFVRLASYGAQTSRKERILFSKDMELSVQDKHVLVVDDIVDTGHSALYLLNVLRMRGAKSLRVCALIDKRERREVDVAVDFAGFVLSEGFVIGYGLDYAERYRHLPAVYTLNADT
ncbi:hypoxanthine phosphoribosyltransferase [Desulfonatronum sp. SC1]|uniref:hypoxanthine phosphoribosyltransferase n=1 Tax=Desulfonatronum sp. SC1 TaxID=2109626 RepID=UPI000D30144E|nr:hypoxanthine phosphoribosyltransferase [Desulfonatronum sp. SC1]PTN38243.1 hypoxanthine phosphoribosyltransferase [Desulfonatronum sp. SC1]